MSLFQAEQEEYLKEGIEWNKIDITGNAGCIDMIENKSSGLLSLLNEECQLPQGNENSLIQKYNNHHTKNKNIYKYDPRKRSEFQVNHYAGNVIYTIDGFIDKNKNTLNADVCKALCNSTSFLVKALFQEESELDQPNKLVPQGRVSNHKNLRRPGSTNKTTVTQKFQRELISLVEFLQNGQSHYVRTIKPNQTKEPRKFESEKVNHQLKCNGVTETVKLRKAGFAQRFTPQSFFNLYKGLGMSNEGEVSSFLKQFGGDGWVKGKTKIFVKLEVLDKLERKRMEIFKNNLLVIQKFVRRHNAIHLMLEKRDLEGKRREEVIRKKKEEEETTKRIKEEKERKEKEVLLARQEAAKKKREEEERRDKAERERIEAQRLLFQKQQEEREKSIAAEKEKARRLEQEQERRRKEVMRHSLRLEELKTERE
uniref:Myosin motor domain-containing protein n=1 Tax=Arcella intermedia TaxID=1963864 RepID=A0A6B2L4F2_9EUKA